MKKSRLIVAYSAIFLSMISALFIISISDEHHNENEEADYGELVTKLRYSTFEEFEVKKEKKDTFVLFVGQEGCGACKELLPTLLEMSNKNRRSQSIFYLDIERVNNSSIKTDYGITATPTMLFIKDGKIVDRLEGSAGEEMDAKLLLDQFESLNFIG